MTTKNKNSYLYKRALFYDRNSSFTFFDILFILFIFILAFIMIFLSLFSRCDIKRGESMEKTLYQDDIILITNYTVKYKNLDIIVLKTEHDDDLLIKRIIATEGERFYFRASGGNVFLYKQNAEGVFLSVDEPYINGYMKTSNFSTINFSFYDPLDPSTIYTVPENSYLYLGDNRNVSIDARVYSYCTYDDIIGKMVCEVEKNTLLYYFVNIIYIKPN